MHRSRLNPDIHASLNAIEVAFPDENPPAYDEIVTRHDFRWDFERDAIREFLAGKQWKALSIEELASYRGDQSAILTFLTPKAFRYYLPAFLSVSLTDNRRADVTVDSTFWKFSQSENPVVQAYMDERIQVLTEAQLDAIECTARVLESVYGPNDTYANAVLDIQRIKRERGLGG